MYFETKYVSNELFWQDMVKKIEETRQRFKNEFLQGNTVDKLTLTDSHFPPSFCVKLIIKFISDSGG